MIILSKVLKESNQFKILAIKVAAKRTLDNALLLIRESLQAMEDAQAGASVEGGFVEEPAIIEAGEDDLLVHFEGGIALLLVSRQVVGRQHLVEYFVAHFFRYFIRVSIELAFLPPAWT